MKELDVEIHARSIFLQGLLLMNIVRWHEICIDLGLPLHHVALDYVISSNYVDQVIVGVETLSQLVDLTFASYGSDLSRCEALSLSDPEILNPALWKLKS